MGRKIIGIARNIVPPQHWSKRWGVLVSIVIAAGAGLIFFQKVLAVNQTGYFDVADGNADSDNMNFTLPDDWDRVCHQVTGADCSTTFDTHKATQGNGGIGSTAVAWISEPDRATSIFTGGGSKDPLDIPGWAWKDAGGLPDKDNLRHAFAVRYSLPGTTSTGICPNGTDRNGGTFNPNVHCEVIFFGSDRFDNSGDAQQGFWFFQKAVDIASNKVGGGSGFSGVHQLGDILVISDFSNGGANSEIAIYSWDPACKNAKQAGCGDTNLRIVQPKGQFNCGSAPQNSPACGFVNNSTITMPWAFTDKSLTPDNGALPNEFYEGGINLSLLGFGAECFSSVSAETRSSDATDAVLKDFVLGQFSQCSAGLTTEAQTGTTDNIVSPGTAVTDLATMTITPASANPADAQGTVNFFLCKIEGTTTDCSSGGTPAGANIPLIDISDPAATNDGISGAQSAQVNTGANPLSTGRYCFRAEATLTNYSNPSQFSHQNLTTECFNVRAQSTATTAQDWIPNDTATVVLQGTNTAATGTVKFHLYNDGTCTGTELYTSGDISLVNGTARSNNTTATTHDTTNNTVSWKVEFTSTDGGVDGTVSNCEKSVVTITD